MMNQLPKFCNLFGSLCINSVSAFCFGSHPAYHTTSSVPDNFHEVFSCSVESDSLWPHGLHQARLHCSSTSPRACSIPYPLSQWCHPTISSSVAPFPSCPHQSFPASGSFPMNQFFASGGQSIGASASVLPMNIQGWVPLGMTGLTSLQSKGPAKVFSSSTVWKHQFFGAQPSLWSNCHMTTGKTIALTIWTFFGKVMSLLFHTLSRFVIAFLPGTKCLLISRGDWHRANLGVRRED